MQAVSRFVLRHKLAVAVFWLIVLAAGGAASAKLSSRLSAQFALPGAAGYQASQQILRIYGNGGPGYPEVTVVTLPPGLSCASPAGRQALDRAFTAAARMPGLRVADYASTGDRAFLTRDPRISYGLVFTAYTGELNPPRLGPQLTIGIIQGIVRTGRLVTGAALILSLAFAALSTGPETDLKVMATALGDGILLDATVVRALLAG